jgi:hypothetical protein
MDAVTVLDPHAALPTPASHDAVGDDEGPSRACPSR